MKQLVVQTESAGSMAGFAWPIHSHGSRLLKSSSMVARRHDLAWYGSSIEIQTQHLEQIEYMQWLERKFRVNGPKSLAKLHASFDR